MNKFLNLFCFTALTVLTASVSFADDLQLDMITVTAEKRTADAQEVASPMNVMTDTFIEDAGLNDVSDVGRYVPNVVIDSSWGLNQTWIVSRGMTTNEYLATSPMVLNYNGMPSDSNFGFNFTFEDIERIEVLRGPQGTLYGKNAMSGVINVVTKQPDNNLTGKIGFSVEERDTYKTKFTVSGPIKEDKLYFGLSGGYQETNGYIEDKTPGGQKDISASEKYHYSAKLRATPTSNSDIMLQYSHSRATGANPPLVFSDSHTYDVYTGFRDDQYDDTVSVTDLLLLNMNFKTDMFDITSISSYKNVDTDETTLMGSQYGSYLIGVQDFELPTYSQEIRISSTDKSHIKWLGGLYYDRSKMDVNKFSNILDNGTMRYTYDYMPEIDSTTAAAFAEATIPLFSDRFALTLGGRYERTEREMDYRLAVLMDNTTLSDDRYSVEKDWSAALGKVAISYKAAENLNLYALVSQGYTPGGFNYSTSDKKHADFNETTSMNYEMGVKSKLLNNRLMLNANIFHTEYDDLQVLETLYASNIVVVKNAGKAHTTGIETDITARLAKGLDIFATAGMMEAKYDDFNLDSVDYDEKYMIGAPKFNATAGISYRHSSGFMGIADVKHTGKTYYTKTNDSLKSEGSYEIVNVKAGYESDKGYEIYLYVRNLTDKEYFSWMRDAGAGTAFNYMGEPRTIGVEVNYRF